MAEEGSSDFLDAVQGNDADIVITQRGIVLAEAAADAVAADAASRGITVKHVRSSPYIRCARLFEVSNAEIVQPARQPTSGWGSFQPARQPTSSDNFFVWYLQVHPDGYCRR